MVELGFLNRYRTNSLLVILFCIIIAVLGISLALTNYALFNTKELIEQSRQIVLNNEQLNKETIEAIRIHENLTATIARIIPLENRELLKNLTILERHEQEELNKIREALVNLTN